MNGPGSRSRNPAEPHTLSDRAAHGPTSDPDPEAVYPPGEGPREAAILAAVESLHRERWPNEGPTYDPPDERFDGRYRAGHRAGWDAALAASQPVAEEGENRVFDSAEEFIAHLDEVAGQPVLEAGWQTVPNEVIEDAEVIKAAGDRLLAEAGE